MAGIADMAVVRPDDGLGLRPLRVQQLAERLEHMRVAQVPAFRRAMIHDPVIFLGILDEPGVGMGVEELVAVLRCIVQAVLQQLPRSEEHTSELQSLMRISYADFCLIKKKNTTTMT